MANITLQLQIDGKIVDVANVDMPDQVLLAAAEAMAVKFNYQNTVVNDKFDPSKDESEDNPRTITNPMSKWRHFSWRLRLYAQEVAREEFVRQGVVAANSQVENTFNNLISAIVVND